MTRTRTILTIAAAAGLCAALLGLVDQPARARPPADSEVSCVNWCFDHNKTDHSRSICLNGCECHYHGNLCASTGRTEADSRATPPNLVGQELPELTPVAPNDAATTPKRRPARTPN